MGKKIIITEKPSVAMEFAKVVSNNFTRRDGYLESEEWIITWCVGHLVTMSYPEKYNEQLKYWRIETLPFIPKDWKYEIIPQVEKQFNIIKSLMTRDDIDEIYNAGDSGREGEYIQRLVLMMVKPDPKIKIKRVWIDSQTEEEIRRGIKEAKDSSEYDSLSDSAYLRAKEDYLIGINFSRMLTLMYGQNLSNKLKTDKSIISIGRVMTCVLGMVVNKEREIRNFVKTPYYKIQAILKEFQAEWKVSETSRYNESPKLYNDTGFKEENEAKKLILELQGKEAIIEEIKKSKVKESAPLLFNLAELQNECSKKFKISPDRALEIAQNLYEKKLITYPRTDARVLSTAIAKVISKNLNNLVKNYKDEEIQSILKEMSENKYVGKLEKTKYVNDKKITDHYAIIPTGQGFENYEKLSELEQQTLKLITKRFLAIFYPPAEFNKLNIVIDIDKEKFTSSDKICIAQGYQKILKNKELDEEERQLTKITYKKGDKLEVENYEIKNSETTPPTRYNSGSIILAMENAGKLIEDEELREQIKGAGIGTSATRAEIIKKLEKIDYIQINNKTQIVTPTQKGEAIFDIVRMSMQDMLNPKLTASWEKGLDLVAKKEIKPEEFMTKLESYIKEKFNRLIKMI
ncbi:MAG: DNA topoisomerase III [Clostridiales bacterium]|nr:DNA topoisomerase III [Clostridiales bacterium]